MDQLFGTFIRVGHARGILVNEQLTRAGRRHTAAHELGHHRFGHRVDPGSPCAVVTDDGSAPPRRWTPDEQAAEAFSDWFLMPLQAVRAALSCLGLNRPDSPASVYQLSLLLGTTYRATARHCVSLRLASSTTGRAWAGVSPGLLKQRMLVDQLSSTRDVDVWWMQQPTGSGLPVTRYLSPGDRLVMPKRSLVDPGELPVAGNGPAQVVLIAPRDGVHTLQQSTVDGVTLDVRIVIEPRPHGLHRSSDSDLTQRECEVTA
ncbi:ImmA/IrrE family metallo-endopeptidase [Janibacter indicus]|uniref:ImmA/IrrE family metallo-endopeptidase n=1 Tax=Janibacter indicus TaxID=857417 RepID=UPI003D9A25B1